MSRHTTRTDDELIDQLMYEFAKKCNYVLTKSLQSRLMKFARSASEICKEMSVDPGTYVEAHITYAPRIRGYSSLTPQQLCCMESKNYVRDFICTKGKRDVPGEFTTECDKLARCMENGWPELLALQNPTFDFSPWFRILIASTRDEELIKKYGGLAAQILNNDTELVRYLKSIKSSEGKGLDFSRIPNFKQ